ncbi:RHS repeat-associated core domain-containing protein [Roseateles amylovorans]|uniref:Type IV secretion protein Rhs n=1 Tax=Roseateles amylovorans TaxID=2978473 RepID=A0ABY6AZ14_9BURK|nr:RHS repeat-associated core domain-containing protein [Roseateles amylovorans]UXH78158.1 type IV secretion protein Rhs [Roseateles amylovorans]
MKNHLGRLRRRMTLVAMAAALISPLAHAATLPPPPVSPAPVTDYEYDAKGNPTKVIKAKGVSGFGFTTQNGYDPLDRLRTNTDAKNGTTTLGYDGQDQVKQVTDPRNLVTTYQRNGLGDLTQLISPDTGTANSTYDAAGNLLTRTDSRGVLATYAYDDLNRLKSIVYTQSGQTSQTYGWTYDQTGTAFGYGVGRLTTATFPTGSTQFGYDAQGRVISQVQNVGGIVLSTRYGYDATGHLTSITYPSGRVLTVVYAGGLPAALYLAADGTATPKPLISGLQWEPFGGLRSWLMHLNSGTKAQERVYDVYGRLVRYPLGDVVRDLTYDAADRIVNYTHLDATTGAATAATQTLEQTFGYDELGRLTTVTLPTSVWSIGYDANGNRTSVTLNGASRAYTTSATSNRLNEISAPVRSFSYDAAGNTTADTSGYTSTYGLDGRMAGLVKAGVTSAYAYNAAGQRVRKISGAQKYHFAYDLDGHLQGEYNSGGGALQEFIWLGDMLVAVITPSSTTEPRVYHAYSDHLNAPRLLIDMAGAQRWRWLSEPFGTTPAEAIPSSIETLAVNLRFPGQYFDKESGLNYNYFRDYDATTGRYVQSDPIGLDGGINTYAYVGGNPLGFSDPMGLQAVPTPWGPMPLPPPVPSASPSGGRGGYDPRSDTYTPSGTNSNNDNCCSSYTDVYEANDEKHGSTPRGKISAEPSFPDLALQNSVAVGRSKIGYDGLSGQVVMFRSHWTDEQKCIKYWHGYVVYQRDLTPEQWKAGRDAGFPNWPRKPK